MRGGPHLSALANNGAVKSLVLITLGFVVFYCTARLIIYFFSPREIQRV